MPFVVTENCIKCKYTDCVEVCPVDCFHEGPNFLVIDPDECIDCTLCEPECPANAIYPEDDVPAGQERFVALNAELSQAWPVITVRKEPLLEGPYRAGEKEGVMFRETVLSTREVTEQERAVGDLVVAELGKVFPDRSPLLYTRVDLIPDDEGSPVVLEVELAEPSLFFEHAPGAVERFADAVTARL